MITASVLFVLLDICVNILRPTVLSSQGGFGGASGGVGGASGVGGGSGDVAHIPLYV